MVLYLNNIEGTSYQKDMKFYAFILIFQQLMLLCI